MLQQRDFWEKVLVDGSLETGTDKKIQARKASWTKGRQDIVSSVVSLNGRKVALTCPEINGRTASWRQLDHNIMSLQSNMCIRTAREVACSPLEYKFVAVKKEEKEAFFCLNNESGVQIPKNTEMVIASIDLHGAVKLDFEATK